jgi:hypothetical protein
MRNAKKKKITYGKKKTSILPNHKSKVKALSSQQKVVNTTNSSTEEVFTATKGRKVFFHAFIGIQKLFLLHRFEIYKHIKKAWQSLTQLLYKLYRKECKLAEALRQYLKTLIGSTLLLLFYTLVGLNSPATYPPLFAIIHQHETVSIIVIIFVTVYLVRVLLVGTKSEQEEDKKPKQSQHQYLHPLLFLNIISYTSSFFLLVVLLLLLIRPAGCPTAICPTPQRILVFHPQGIHDRNLEMYFIANQSTFYVIPGNPSQYTQSNLPQAIPALHTDGEKSLLFYNLSIGLNSLQQGHFGMIIEEVNLAILQVAPLPHPLNVWNDTSSYVHYENENQYRGIYLGQQAGAVIPTDYLRFQYGFVQLKPGEADQIDIHVISRIEANIWFTVQVVYRIDNESQLYTLRLPQQFEIMFANKSDWHLYS